MTVEQRDVYLYPPSHDPSLEHHPFIVLSVKVVNRYENTFVACMITSSEKYRDDFSFELTDEMFESPLHKKNSHVRMHLVTLCLEKDIQGTRINRMKPFYFRQLMESVGDLVFNYVFSPLD